MAVVVIMRCIFRKSTGSDVCTRYYFLRYLYPSKTDRASHLSASVVKFLRATMMSPPIMLASFGILWRGTKENAFLGVGRSVFNSTSSLLFYDVYVGSYISMDLVRLIGSTYEESSCMVCMSCLRSKSFE